MISALVSTLIGAGTGLIPDVMKYFTAKQDAKLELELLALNNKHSLAVIAQNLEVERLELARQSSRQSHEQDLAASVSEREIKVSFNKVVATEEEMYTKRLASLYENQSKTKISWINGLNALLRPVLAAMVMLLFIWTVVMYMSTVFSMTETGAELLLAIEGFWAIPLVEIAIVGPLGFLFGQRQVRKKALMK